MRESKRPHPIALGLALLIGMFSVMYSVPDALGAQTAANTDGDGADDASDIDDDNDGILDSVESPVSALVSWPVAGARPNFQDEIVINAPEFVASGVTVTGGPAVGIALAPPTGFFGFYGFGGATPGDVNNARAGGHWIEASFTTSSDFVDGGVRIVSISHLPRSNVPYRYTVAISDDGFTTETVLASDHSWQVSVPPMETEYALDPNTTYEIRWYTHNSTDQNGNPNLAGTGHRFDGLQLNFVEDPDGDGLQNSVDIDSDNDGIPDNVEGPATQDFIVPVYVDSDGNGLLDVYESAPGVGEGVTPVNTDGTGEPDYLDLDSDDDGALDIAEADRA